MASHTVLVIGARGAVGTAATAALRTAGHRVVEVSRRPGAGGVAADITTAPGRAALADAATRADVVIDASGLEIAEVQDAVGSTPLVDVSATASHLERLRRRADRDATVLLGAGIAPGASTVLVNALGPQPGDEIDVAVMLGGGEEHGPQAVEWTVRLAGATVHAAPEPHPVRNFASSRRLSAAGGGERAYLRADFPDDLLVGAASGAIVRSWLALDNRLATGVLRVVGALPALAPALRRAPHLGGTMWRVAAVSRASGREIAVSGDGQSIATGRLAALAAMRLVERGLRGVVTMADVVGVDELEDAAGVRLERAGALSA